MIVGRFHEPSLAFHSFTLHNQHFTQKKEDNGRIRRAKGHFSSDDDEGHGNGPMSSGHPRDEMMSVKGTLRPWSG